MVAIVVDKKSQKKKKRAIIFPFVDALNRGTYSFHIQYICLCCVAMKRETNSFCIQAESRLVSLSAVALPTVPLVHDRPCRCNVFVFVFTFVFVFVFTFVFAFCFLK